MKYNKQPETFDQQLDRLIKRGMMVSDRPLALHYLSQLNYYRLGAYWLPFEASHATHTFKLGTRFEDVLNLYVFDRELRMLVMDAIERIEVSVRTQLAYHLSHKYGAHFHLNQSLFATPYKRWDFARNNSQLRDEVLKSKETFIKHLRDTYDEPLPPIWALVEILTLGQLSLMYGSLGARVDRNLVAHTYDFDEKHFVSFMHHLSTVRNICAHHGRLWNRRFVFTLSLPNQRPLKAISSLNLRADRSLYNTLVIMSCLMDQISPSHHWRSRLLTLIDEHKPDLSQMGFPADWRRRSIWL